MKKKTRGRFIFLSDRKHDQGSLMPSAKRLALHIASEALGIDSPHRNGKQGLLGARLRGSLKEVDEANFWMALPYLEK